MMFECVVCHKVFEANRTRRVCGECKFFKAVAGYKRVTGGANMPNLGTYGAKESKYPPLFKADDIKTPTTLIIAAAEARELRGEKKVILGFKGEDRQLVLNKTNIGALVEKFGDVEPSALIGKTIMIASVPTQFEGKSVKGIRVVG